MFKMPRSAQSVKKYNCNVWVITPQIAQIMLGDNKNNRGKRKNTIDNYVKEINMGEWTITSNAIGFDEDGILVDGQHRLQAVIDSGKSIESLVVFGLPKASIKKTDRGLSRSLVDAVNLSEGLKIKNIEVAVTRCLVKHKDSWQRCAFNDATVVEALKKHRKSIKFVCSIARSRGLRPAPYLAACVVVLEKSKNEDACADFMGKVDTGVGIPSKNHPTSRIRNFLIDTNCPSGSTGQEVIFEKTLFAFKAFLNNKEITQMGRLKNLENDDILRPV